MSIELKIDVMVGYLEKSKQSQYSSYLLIEDGRITQNYRRILKGWKEHTITDHHYKEGGDSKTFNYKGKKCLIALCGDLWEFPKKFVGKQGILFRSIYVDFSLDDWKSTFTKGYCDFVKTFNGHILLIGSICESTAFGGCIHVNNGNVQQILEPGTTGLLTIAID